MTDWFITRHKGAAEWAAGEGIAARAVSHFDTSMAQPGDRVLGTLPVSEAAKVCARGARYLHLTLDLPEALRGKELSAEQMRACGAQLEEYDVRRV
jgi:CRISPR-associated protein Csx16